MSSDLEQRLRSAGDLLPEPDEDARRALQQTIRSALDEGTPPRAGGHSWLRPWPRRNALLVTALALVGAAGAVAGTGWSPADLPPFGRDDQSAFVLPTTDVLPGGYPRSQPPRYDDLPPRPSLLFPPGVDYAEAVRRYAAARREGLAVPVGAALSAPLPEGKVVLVQDDGRVAIDPAAPVGYSTRTRLVEVLSGPPAGGVRLARCQILLGAPDRGSPSCADPGANLNYVRSGVAGRWILSAEEPPPDEAVTASTRLSVIDRPTLPAASPPDAVAERLRDLMPGGRASGQSVPRLALSQPNLRVYVAPGDSGRVCAVAVEGTATVSGSCVSRGILASRGASTFTTSAAGAHRVTGLVGDGMDRVATGNGASTRIRNNVFSLVVPADTGKLTFSGPAGSFEVALAGGEVRRPEAPVRSLRPLLGIRLAGGGRAAVRAGASSAAERCWAVTIRGEVRSNGCTRSDDPLPYDVVTGGVLQVGGERPGVYHGVFAPAVGAVELDAGDGRKRRFATVEGHVLFEMPARTDGDARGPVSVTTLDRAGVALVEQQLPDGSVGP